MGQKTVWLRGDYYVEQHVTVLYPSTFCGGSAKSVCYSHLAYGSNLSVRAESAGGQSTRPNTRKFTTFVYFGS